jgi:DNA-binding CsgD family transcriptional regulator
MHFDLAHFPDFQEGLFSGNVSDGTLEMLVQIRQQLSCRHITHIGHSAPQGTHQGPAPEISVLTTLPMNWVLRYSAKNYYKVDPLVQGITIFPHPAGAPGTIRNLTAETGLEAQSKQFLRDCELRGLGNLFLAVDACNSYGFRGITEFTFEIETSEQAAFIDRTRKRLAAVATRLHNTLHGNRNPVLAAVVANLLTKREIDCLYWAANGKTDGEIGEILNIARWTVVTYLQNAKNKLGCSNRTSTVATALALGVIQMPAITNRFK